MDKMFESATLKLTGWYLFIIFLICLLFSFIVYQISSRELAMRLQGQTVAVQRQFPAFRGASTAQIQNISDNQLNEGRRNLKLSLLYTNSAILLVGGAGSYLLARRTLEPIEEAHEAQSRFTSDASHELRTPLATMQTEIEVILRDKNTSKQELKELLISNLEEVEKLKALSEALLRLAQLDNGALAMQTLSLEEVIEKAKQRLASEARKKRITIVANLKPILITGNETTLIELLTILLSNALKYSYENGIVEISLQRKNTLAVLKIKDHGSGIAKKDLPYIFDRFYRGDVSRTKNTTYGYGLGLALADQIVDLHNGDIVARSSKKTGTIFTISLPIS